MKTFVLGIITTLIIGAWITLAVVGVISVKTAILVPIGIFIGLLIAVWLFGLFWDSQEIKECGEEECELINKAQKFINKPIF